jgi:hypothetical protein
VAGELLLDTGALVSLLDRSQHRHAVCTECFETWSGEIVTTEAVLTDAIHLLTRVRGGPEACLDFVLSGGAVLVPASNASLRRARALIEQYRDLPMDYADATLVALAEDIGTNLVFTTDRRDFSIYRIGGRQEFTLLPPV